METLSFNPPVFLVEGGKWLLAVTCFETTSFVFNITDENNSCWIIALGRWNSEVGGELINKLHKSLEVRSKNDFELHVKKVEKSGTRKKIQSSGYNLERFDYLKVKYLQIKKSKI